MSGSIVLDAIDKRIDGLYTYIDSLELQIKNLDFSYATLWTQLENRIKKLEDYIEQSEQAKKALLSLIKGKQAKKPVIVFNLNEVMDGIEKELSKKEDSK